MNQPYKKQYSFAVSDTSPFEETAFLAGVGDSCFLESEGGFVCTNSSNRTGFFAGMSQGEVYSKIDGGSLNNLGVNSSGFLLGLMDANDYRPLRETISEYAFGNSGNILENIWNSRIARGIIPEAIGFSVTGNLVNYLGAGKNYDCVWFLRGPNASLRSHFHETTSVRGGNESSDGFGLIYGCFQGPVCKINSESILGGCWDASVSLGVISYSPSIAYKEDGATPAWYFHAISVGIGGGYSTGIGITKYKTFW